MTDSGKIFMLTGDGSLAPMEEISTTVRTSYRDSSSTIRIC